MNICQGDIIVRTFQNTPTVWVSERLICNTLGNNIDEYLRRRARFDFRKSVSSCHHSQSILPATGKSWRYARIDGRYYYDYDYIPDRKDTRYRSRLGDKETLLQKADELRAREARIAGQCSRKSLEEYVKEQISNADILRFRYYEVDGVLKYNKDKARELAEALAWARCIKSLVADGGYKDFGYRTKEDFYKACALILHRKRLEGFTVTTGGSLRNKLRDFPSDESAQYAFFVSGRYGNDNARKLGRCKIVDEETGEIKRFDIHEALILKLWMNFGGSAKESKVVLWGRYERDIVSLGEKPLSYSTFCHYTNMYNTRRMTYRERHGWKAFASAFLSYIPSEKLRYGNSLWCADGSGTLAYSYQDKKGKLRSMRLYVMMVSDVATGRIVGWAPAPRGQHTETPEMMREAVLMGLRSCGRREIMEFISDNHGAFTSEESVDFLSQVCRKVRTICPGNSQANYAETQFRLFKRTIRGEFNWLGSSWDSRNIENTANDDYLDAASFPSYEEVIEQVGRKIEEWNNRILRSGESRSELYEGSLHPEAREIDPRLWRYVAGYFTVQEITRQRGNIVIAKGERKYMFEIPEVESVGEVIRQYLGYAAKVKVRMYWDEEECDLYTMDDRFMFTCFAARKASLSHAEETEQSVRNLGHHVWRQAAQREAVTQYEDEVKEVADWIDERLPYEITSRLISDKRAKEITNAQKEKALAEKMLAKTVLKQRQKAAETEKKQAERAYEEYARSIIDLDKFRDL